jgi:hypothetical protein
MIKNETLLNEINHINKALVYINKYSKTEFDQNTKYKNMTFLYVYNNFKDYVYFIKKLTYFKNPLLRTFKNYLIYMDFLKLNN